MFVFGRRLKIDEARVNDSGWYSCEGFNHYGHQSTTAYLHIRHGKIHMTAVLFSEAIMGTEWSELHISHSTWIVLFVDITPSKGAL